MKGKQQPKTVTSHYERREEENCGPAEILIVDSSQASASMVLKLGCTKKFCGIHLKELMSGSLVQVVERLRG